MVGFMDVLSFPEINKHYRLVINKHGKLDLISINKDEANFKVCKIIGKTKLKKGLLQLNLDDSSNIIVKEDKYKLGDSLVIEFPNNIKEVLKFEKGALVYLIKGKHIGKVGKIKDIAKEHIILKTKDGQEFKALKSYAFIIGKEKPSLTIENKVEDDWGKI